VNDSVWSGARSAVNCSSLFCTCIGVCRIWPTQHLLDRVCHWGIFACIHMPHAGYSTGGPPLFCLLSKSDEGETQSGAQTRNWTINGPLIRNAIHFPFNHRFTPWLTGMGRTLPLICFMLVELLASPHHLPHAQESAYPVALYCCDTLVVWSSLFLCINLFPRWLLRRWRK